MKIRVYHLALVIIAFIGVSAFFNKRNILHKPPSDNFVVDTLATGLTVPWAITFLPDKTMLFSERNGKVRLFRNHQLLSKPIHIVRETDTTKKMGLLGMCIHPDFIKNKYVYLSYNYRKENSPLLRVVRFEFRNDTLLNPKIIIDNIEGSPNHTGCRLKFGPDGKLYITTGDADHPILAQDLKSLNGKILRVNDDGSIPPDNPFVKNDTARKEIWTYGHRNTQGIDFQPGTGYLYNSEHGPTGGDEINRINKGLNYGWPVIHHSDTKEGMVSPLVEYTPSIGPSEIIFYNADAFPGMKGNLLLACLRGECIIRFQVDKEKVVEQEVLLKQQYGRIRALAVGPDGYIYFSTSQNDPPEGSPRPGYDMVLRLRPSGSNNPRQSNEIIKTGNAEKNIGRANTPKKMYQQLCASCHGENLEGTERAKSMLDAKWEYGSNKKDIIKVIREGVIEKGMPAWEGAISKKDMEKLADFIIAKSRKSK